jgi:hypothetical protein
VLLYLLICLVDSVDQKLIYRFGILENSSYLFSEIMLDGGIKGPLLPQLESINKDETKIGTIIYLCKVYLCILIL